MINAIYKSFENGILAQTRRWDVSKVKKRDDLTDLLSFVYVHLKYFSWHELHMLTDQQSSISS